MAKRYKRKKSQSKSERSFVALALFSLPICFLVVFISFAGNTLNAYKAPIPVEVPEIIKPTDSFEKYVTEYFTRNGAEELIPIIECESEFKHYDESGEVLKNRLGSSATGVAQIMASVHPDPNVIKRYNKRNNAKLAVEDFDITTLSGNVGYALILYRVRGVKDWECAKKIR